MNAVRMLAPPGVGVAALLIALVIGLGGGLASAASQAHSDGAADGENDESLERSGTLQRALEPLGWMSQQPSWPCRYGAHVEQLRHLGGRALRSTGRLLQDCKLGLIWQVERPQPGVRIYARGGNYLALDRRGTPRALHGLAERRIAALLQDLFAGNLDALQRDFAHQLVDDDGRQAVRLVPRDSRLASRLNGILIQGDAGNTTIRVETAGDGEAGTLTLHLDRFRVVPGGKRAQAASECLTWLSDTGPEPGVEPNLASAACDALERPGRWLDKARG